MKVYNAALLIPLAYAKDGKWPAKRSDESFHEISRKISKSCGALGADPIFEHIWGKQRFQVVYQHKGRDRWAILKCAKHGDMTPEDRTARQMFYGRHLKGRTQQFKCRDNKWVSKGNPYGNTKKWIRSMCPDREQPDSWACFIGLNGDINCDNIDEVPPVEEAEKTIYDCPVDSFGNPKKHMIYDHEKGWSENPCGTDLSKWPYKTSLNKIECMDLHQGTDFVQYPDFLTGYPTTIAGIPCGFRIKDFQLERTDPRPFKYINLASTGNTFTHLPNILEGSVGAQRIMIRGQRQLKSIHPDFFKKIGDTTALDVLEIEALDIDTSNDWPEDFFGPAGHLSNLNELVFATFVETRQADWATPGTNIATLPRMNHPVTVKQGWLDSMSDVSTFYLFDNGMTELPHTIWNDKLAIIDLKDNQLEYESLPLDLPSMESIQVINFENNKFDWIPTRLLQHNYGNSANVMLNGNPCDVYQIKEGVYQAQENGWCDMTDKSVECECYSE